MSVFKLLKQYSIFKYPFWDEIKLARREYLLGLIALLCVDCINVLLPLVLKEAVDALIPPQLSRVYWMAGTFAGLMLLQSYGRYLWRYFLIGSSHRVALNLRLKFYDHLQRLPYRFYQNIRTGDLMSRATNDIESIRMAVGPGVLVAMDAIFLFSMILPAMLYLSVKLSLLAFAFYPLVPWLTARMGNRIDDLFEKLQKQMSAMGAFVQESFGGIRLIKSLTLESNVLGRFGDLSAKYREIGIEEARYQAVLTPALSLITNLGTFLILLAGGMDVIHGTITVGTFVAFQRFVVQLSWPMEAVGWALTISKEGTAAKRRLKDIFNTEKATASHPSPFVGVPSTLLEVSRLRFAYPATGSGEISPFKLEIEELVLKSGKKIGLVGPVGGGKTTLFQLILRLFEPPEGSVYFQGRDVRAVSLSELRRSIVTVEQQVFLFSESIVSNLFMGLTGEGRDAQAAIHAARVACMDAEVSELQNGYDTLLGERGVNLSGGQKQRLALARALMRDPKLLLLDDCFSAVDVAVEKRILDAFFREYPKMSVLIATHRLAAMPRMDEVWVMEHGQILDRGSHRELLERNWLYRALWEKSERQLAKQAVARCWEGEVST